VDKYLEWLDRLEFGDFKLPRPDRVLFLDVPLEVSRRLMEERGIHKTNTAKDIHEENADHLRKAYDSGLYCANKLGWDIISCTDKGNMKSIEEISELIWDRVSQDIVKIEK
jgi:dTMP kinase